MIPVGRGQRLILLHAVDQKTGFLPDCKLLFKSVSTDGRDYHTEMNGTVFENWVENKLLPSLDVPSVVIMDNASYHTRKDPETSAPNMSNKLQEMRNWLTHRGIKFPEKGPGSYKKDLLVIINEHKPQQLYIADKMIEQHGHQVLRLPPYHCQFNPIELLWGIIKNDVASNNTEFKLDAMRKLTDDAISKVSLETIQKSFRHAEKIENEYWLKDGLHAAPVIDPIIINTQQDSSDEYTSYESSSSTDSDS